VSKYITTFSDFLDEEPVKQSLFLTDAIQPFSKEHKLDFMGMQEVLQNGTYSDVAIMVKSSIAMLIAT